MNELSGEDEIRALHERHAPDRRTFDLVWQDCVTVWRIAERLVTTEDAALVKFGCLVHDIGVYRLAGRPDRAVDRRRRVAPDRLLPCANQASLGTERRGRF
ncbi:hypothetical protein ACFPIJ_15815 [Dactylosporangium cerinum]|uniref:HD domain-containing protein n=1 Tax=Dactylosporangium cerinum TaxID=1434730 RepID=A0ABV9VTH7_9ACTN